MNYKIFAKKYIQRYGDQALLDIDTGYHHWPKEASEWYDRKKFYKERREICEFTKALIDSGADIHAKNNFGPIFSTAAWCGYAPVVDALLEHGADVNEFDDSGTAALLYARGLDVVKSLIRAGADVNAIDDEMYTRLHIAVINDEISIAKVLIEAGANLELREYCHDYTPLMSAVSYAKKIETIQILVESGANINTEGMTSLHLAASRGNLKIVQFLVESGGNIFAKDSDNETPYDWAVHNNHLHVAEFLKQSSQL